MLFGWPCSETHGLITSYERRASAIHDTIAVVSIKRGRAEAAHNLPAVDASRMIWSGYTRSAFFARSAPTVPHLGGAPMTSQRWNADVTDLVLALAEGLRALVPAFDRANVQWRSRDDRYDDFDRIAEALFTSFVVTPALHDDRFMDLSIEQFRPFGFSGPAETWRAQVEVRHPELGDMGALLDLDTSDEPFDQVVVEHEIERVGLAEVVCGVRAPKGDLVRCLIVDQ